MKNSTTSLPYQLVDSTFARINHRAYLRRLGRKAGEAWDSRDYDEAHKIAARMLRISKQSGDPSLISWALSTIGYIHWQLGQHAQALEACEASLAIEKKLGNAARIANSTCDVGALLTRLEEFECGERILMESLELNRKHNLQGGVAKCHLYLASSTSRRHNHSAAIVYATESSELYLTDHQQEREAQSRFYLATSLLLAGRIGDSSAEVERVLSLYRSNSLPGIQRALGLQAWQKFAEGDIVASNKLLSECIELSEYAHDSDGMQVAAHIYWLLGNTDASVNLLQRVLEWVAEDKQRERATVLNAMGYKEMFAGKHEQAEANLIKALRMHESCNDRRGVSYALNNLGYLHSVQGRFPEARGLYLRNIKIKLDRNDDWGAAYTLAGLADCYLNSGSIHMAAKLLGNASATWDKLSAPIEEPVRPWFDKIALSAQSTLGEEDYLREFLIGQQTSWREMSEYILQIQ